MAADVAQRERSNIECYASAFSNIQNIDIDVLIPKKMRNLINKFETYKVQLYIRQI